MFKEVCIRALAHQRVWDAKAAWLVNSTHDEIALWMPAGSQFAVPQGYRENSQRFREERWVDYAQNSWQLDIGIWKQNNVLIVKPKDEIYSVMHFWNADSGEFLGYYVNFDLPYKQDTTGYETLDLELDIMVYPDLSWEYKDEAEYQAALEQGFIEHHWNDAIETSKSQIIQLIETRSYPFNGHWLDFHDNHKDVPAAEFPSGWNLAEADAEC